MHVCMDVCIQLYSCMHVFTYVRVYNICMYVVYCIEVGMQLHKKLELQEAHPQHRHHYHWEIIQIDLVLAW